MKIEAFVQITISEIRKGYKRLMIYLVELDSLQYNPGGSIHDNHVLSFMHQNNITSIFCGKRQRFNIIKIPA